MPLKYRTVDEMTPEMNIIKMMMIDEPEVLDPAITKLPLHFTEKYTTVKSTPFYYEIMNKNASKGNALAKLADHLGLNKDEVMAIGDNENDLSMIDYAGIGVAMGNATENVKTIADVHTTSNDEDGVAQIIEKNGFNLNILFNNNNPQSNQHRLRVIRYFMMLPLAIFQRPSGGFLFLINGLLLLVQPSVKYWSFLRVR